MTLIHNGRAPAKVRLHNRASVPPARLSAASPARSYAVFALPPTGSGVPEAAAWQPIGNLPHVSVMLDLAAFTRCRNGNPGRPSGRSCARVAERQTRWLQVPVSERAWGFKSPLAHA